MDEQLIKILAHGQQTFATLDIDTQNKLCKMIKGAKSVPQAIEIIKNIDDVIKDLKNN